tara:strand:- start:19748 stop:20344 length:597 start_codon:yes stop_codon:yes gene_type:complete
MGHAGDGDISDACGGDAYEDEVDDDAYSVVEEGFAGDFGLEGFRGSGGLEDTEDGYGVCGGDEGSEDQAPGIGDLDAEHVEDVVGNGADGEGGDGDAEGGHDGDDAFLLFELGEVYMECAGEEEVAEHAVHECFVEVDGFYEGFRGVIEGGDELAYCDHDEAHDEGDEHDSDGDGELYPAVVDVGEECREGEQDGGDI